MSEIGILGGSFDPFHNGHLSIAGTAMKECGLSRVILMPARVQPFKIGREMASEEDRLSMVSLIAKKNDNFTVSDLEACGEEVSYTYDTLQKLKNQYPGHRFHFIMGTDSFLSLEHWYRGTDILKDTPIIVGVRPGYKESEALAQLSRYRTEYGAQVKFLHNRLLEVSSTEIKERIRAGESIRSMVPYEIERYIHEHGLYQKLY